MPEVDYAAMGRLAVERKETKDRIDQIKSELNKAGHLMTQLGSALSNYPSEVVFAGQSVSMRHLRSNMFEIKDGFITNLKELTNELREKIERGRELEQQAQLLGI